MYLLVRRAIRLGSLLGLSSVCQAQLKVDQTSDCKYLKLQLPTRLSYTSIIEVPPDYKATGNRFFTLDLSKHMIKSDTLFILGVSIQAVNVSTQVDSATVTFQFSDGVSLVKVKQPLEVLLMTKGNALLSTNVRLAKNELLSLQDKSLINITVHDSKVFVVEDVAKSFKKIANCLLTIW